MRYSTGWASGDSYGLSGINVQSFCTRSEHVGGVKFLADEIEVSGHRREGDGGDGDRR